MSARTPRCQRVPPDKNYRLLFIVNYSPSVPAQNQQCTFIPRDGCVGAHDQIMCWCASLAIGFAASDRSELEPPYCVCKPFSALYGMRNIAVEAEKLEERHVVPPHGPIKIVVIQHVIILFCRHEG